MWSIIAARVVDLPEPVVPVSRTMPRSSSARSRVTGGRRSSSIDLMSTGIARITGVVEHRAHSAVGVLAGEAREAVDRAHDAVDAHDGRGGHLEVQVRATGLDE